MVRSARARSRFGLMVIIFLACAAPPKPPSAFDFARYRPYTLNQAVADHSYAVGDADVSITAADFPYKVIVDFLGEQRTIRSDIQSVIDMWARGLGHPPLTDVFRHEILVREASQEHWLPIQEVLVPALHDEAPLGGVLELYILWIGATRTEWVFIINGFQLVRAAG